MGNFGRVLSGLLLLLFASTMLSVAEPSSGEPVFFPICLGYDPETQTWGAKDPDSQAVSLCPKNQAIMAIRPPLGKERSGEAVPVLGSCCPLPDGALTEKHVFVLEECPTGSVATGSKKIHDAQYYVRCTFIDTSRYRLGERASGRRIDLTQEYFSELRDRFLGTNNAPEVAWTEIPIALRYGFGRSSRTSWLSELCFGAPAGALLAAKGGKYCGQHFFRQLFVRRDQETSEHSIPVEIPLCAAIDDPLRPDARCLSEERDFR